MVTLASTDPRLHRIVAAQPYPLNGGGTSASPRSAVRTFTGLASQAGHKMDAPNREVRFAHRGPPPDSDFDLRGTHVLPLEKVVGLEVQDETVEQSVVVPPHPGTERPLTPTLSPSGVEGAQIEGEGGALEMNVVSHDVRKFSRLLLKRNAPWHAVRPVRSGRQRSAPRPTLGQPAVCRE
jgi:hypothetical protein